MTEAAPLPDQNDIIVCRVTPWFYKRMGLLAAMLLGMGFYFFYDGRFGYPKENEIAARKDWFENEYLKSFDRAKAAGKLDEWIADAKAQKLPSGENGEPPKWASFAAQRGWPESVKRHSAEEVSQQFSWAAGMGLGGLAVLLKMLLDRRRKLTGYADQMIMPNGAEVRFAQVYKVDKRKWPLKGLAYVHYRREGAEKRAVVDDLKYDGAGKVLDRLLSRFQGELIEKAPEEPESSPPAAESKAS